MESVTDVLRTVVLILAMIFWGVIGFWGAWVAVFGGEYPWPLINLRTDGGNWLAALIFLGGGGIAVGATMLVYWLVVHLPLLLIGRLAGRE